MVGIAGHIFYVRCIALFSSESWWSRSPFQTILEISSAYSKPFNILISIHGFSALTMNKRRLYTFTLVTALISAGCQNDEVNPTSQDTTTPKLDYYTEAYDVPGLGFVPQTKVSYDYNDAGKVSKYTVFSYNTDSGSLEYLRSFVFSYVNNRVDKIRGYLAGSASPYVEYSYEYLINDNVSRVTESNHSAGINSEANFSYNVVNNSIKVAYTFSNGASFDYEFNYDSENIQNDRTTRGSQVCSDGQYTYDQHTNPFSNLGYVDYMLNNLSVNNILTEAVNCVGCSFPTLVPVSYSYEYDDKGYPTEVTTLYKSGSSVTMVQKEIFYK